MDGEVGKIREVREGNHDENIFYEKIILFKRELTSLE